MISTRDLSQLPEIRSLKKLTQSLAMLDAIMMPDWSYRYYSFNAMWDDGEQMASMNNGQGDEWYCLFNAQGAILKGFDHESVMSPWARDDHSVWPGVLDEVPERFSSFLKEPAFSIEDTTFCFWRSYADSRWRTGQIIFPENEDDPDGSGWLLSILDGKAETYQHWAEEYYERVVSLTAVERIYQHEVLTESLARELNPDAEWKALVAEAAQIQYLLG